MTQSLAALADDLRCSICLSTLKQPKVLPCCHTFCKGCLSKLPVMRKPEDELSVRGEPPSSRRAQSPGSTSEPEHTSDAEEKKTVESDVEELEPGDHDYYPFDYDEPSVVPEQDNDSLTLDIDPSDGDFPFLDFITCPQCRAEHKVSGSSIVDGFLTDYTSESLLREQRSSSKSEKDLRCDGCDNLDPAVAFCSDCLERLCDFCSNAHKRLKRFARHNVKQLMTLNFCHSTLVQCMSVRIILVSLYNCIVNSVTQLYVTSALLQVNTDPTSSVRLAPRLERKLMKS